MSLDRNIAPKFYPVTEVAFPAFESLSSTSGIPIHIVNDPNSGVLKVELVFFAGNRYQDNPYEAFATNNLLTEGTTSKTAQEISEELDFYGAYIQTRSGLDDSSLILYCLPKHLNDCLLVIEDVLNNAQFSDYEIDVLKKNALQRLKVNESKNSFLARRAFYSSIWGSKNQYGVPVLENHIKNISRETLLNFYQKRYVQKVAYVLASGTISEKTQSELLQFFSRFHRGIKEDSIVSINSNNDKTVYVERPKSVQNSIRIGRKLMNREHKDYRNLQVLNLILGGYFGSRLMKNIREEKGLTYGIHSSMESHLSTGAFYIETEINTELYEIGLKEIHIELTKLRDIEVGKEELVTAKNYMLGSFLKSLDGPFSIADRVKILIDYNLKPSYYEEFIEIINNISSFDIQGLANEYLSDKDLTTVVVGKK